MQQTHTVEERLAAVERALTDDASVATVDDAAALTERMDRIEDRLDAMESRVDEVDAAVHAVRGYVGEIRHVNAEVERTANAAVAAVDRLDAASGTPPPIATADRERASVPDASRDGATEGDGATSLRDRLRALL